MVVQCYGMLFVRPSDLPEKPPISANVNSLATFTKIRGFPENRRCSVTDEQGPFVDFFFFRETREHTRGRGVAGSQWCGDLFKQCTAIVDIMGGYSRGGLGIFTKVHTASRRSPMARALLLIRSGAAADEPSAQPGQSRPAPIGGHTNEHQQSPATPADEPH